MQKTPYPAPDFRLYDSEGRQHSLTDYKSRWLVLYFYPKDDTPGCTVEACSLRDARSELENIGTDIIGISADDSDSHAKFAKKYQLNFTLLADPEREVIKKYDAWGKKMFGREGILRKTFIINPRGQVVKVYGRVTPLGHGEQLAADIAELQKS